MGFRVGPYKNATTLSFGLNNHTNASFNVELDYQYRFSYSKKWKLGMEVGYQQAKFSVGRGYITTTQTLLILKEILLFLNMLQKSMMKHGVLIN